MKDMGVLFSSLFTSAAELMGSYHGNRKAGTKNIFYTTSFIPPPTFSLPTGASSHIQRCELTSQMLD